MVGCGIWREALSACLDGEADAAETAALDAHLAGCSACRTWLADATALTRLARVGLAVPFIGVPDTVLDAAPTARRAGILRVLRIVLAVLGAGQFVLGVLQLAHPMGGGMDGGLMGGATPDHLTHESAAWNLAIGAGFLFVACRRTRPSGVLPMLTVFVAALTVLSLGDVLTGVVAPSRLASHGLLIVGYAVVVAMSRPSLTFEGPYGARRRPGRSRWHVELSDDRPALDRTPERNSPAASIEDRPAAATA